MENNNEKLSLEEKLELIRIRARRLGFCRHDLEDAIQEIAITILDFEYDPENEHGASESTALTTVIDNRLISLIRSQRSFTDLLSRVTDELVADYSGYEDGPCETQSLESSMLQIDLGTVMETMDEEMQQVCQRLMAGESIKAIAKTFGYGWHRVDRIVAQIRERLEAAGLNSIDAE